MSEINNLHCGHRARMAEKILNNPSVLADHELLEVLLYSTLPRINTNPIAHKLIEVFGSLEGVFSASVKELLVVKGVGKRTAENIRVCGEIISRVKKREKGKRQMELNPQTFIEYFQERLADKTTEELLVLLLNKKRQIISELVYSQGLHASVSGDVQEIAKVISLSSPKYVVFAHNHPYNDATPSPSDDVATTKLTLLAMSHGTVVLDHIIIGKDNAFSYHQHGNLASIRESFQGTRLIKKIND